MANQPKWMTITGWVLSALLSALLVFGGVFMVVGSGAVGEGNAEFKKNFVEKSGYPLETALPIGIAALASVIVFLFPRTAVFGAVLLTGYLGGATATHVRVHEPFVIPIITGMLVWLAVFFREPRVRAILPWVTNPK